MDTRFLFKALHRHFIVFLVIAIVFIGLGVFLNWWMTPMYEAKTTLISNSIPDDDRDSRYTSIMANQLLTKTYEEAIQSLFIASDVKSKLNTPHSPGEMLKMVKVQTDPATLIIETYVTSDDPREAVAIANAFAESFVSLSKQIIMNSNVTLLDLAVYDDSSEPVSPKKVFNIAICTFIGLFVGMSVALLLESQKQAKQRPRARRLSRSVAN